MAESQTRAFNFGKNWQAFSQEALDVDRLTAARQSLATLIGAESLRGLSVLDIGCGSGIFALAAAQLGAGRVVGVDLSAESVQASRDNQRRFAPDMDITFRQQSVFDLDAAECGRFDIVYSWGVLHHTGQMIRAIDQAAALVERDGLFVIAIYNRHWSSRTWLGIKWLYNRVPHFVQKIMVWCFCGVIAVAKFLVTGRNPFRKRRGMSFYHDVVDWVGGYPYEYASAAEIAGHVEALGFRCLKTVPPAVPTGCNEFVFQRIA